MFTAALVTIAKTGKQPKHPSTYDWFKKIWCIYTMEYYSAIKKNEILPFAATWMDLENILLSEIRERQILHDITYTWNLKKIKQMNLYTEQKQTHRHRKQTNGYQRGEGGRDKLGVWD